MADDAERKTAERSGGESGGVDHGSKGSVTMSLECNLLAAAITADGGRNGCAGALADTVLGEVEW